MVNIDELKGKITSKGMNVADLAIKINMHPATLYRRLQQDEEFTLGEVELIKEALDLSPKQARDIFFA